MLSNKARLALFDILDNGKLAQGFVSGQSFEDFKEDRRTFYAVTRALEIVLAKRDDLQAYTGIGPGIPMIQGEKQRPRHCEER